ncbi:phosphatase PAP2 family protein [Paracoccus sp. CPCC 101403]|uniref:Phosphatase PAP2 family protein n=1 Tax=Paracoccus broussonetiae TaxID=3075834 RepID=A0ABU3EGK4_9RHOB|nr:phosphatase PAP2 family protein [Paracoccus sp. CPCC 101403]MDT1063378.1 phosphatase PAP2 family protein [Paracoccus sp. CPCC 101403]
MNDPLFSRLHVIALTSALAVACIFAAFPGLDLAISGLFTNGQGRFALAGSSLAIAVNDVLRIGLNAFFIAICVLVLIGRGLRLTARSGADNWRFLAGVFLMGPGLIVNGLLKSWVGRARPVQITEFGGEKLFTPMLQISDQCALNCSFSSGEVAMVSTFVFAMLVLAWPHLGRRGKPVAAVSGVLLICLSVLLRVGLGRHFMSDALSSVAISALVVLAAYRVFDLAQARMRLTPGALIDDCRTLIAIATGRAAPAPSRTPILPEESSPQILSESATVEQH